MIARIATIPSRAIRCCCRCLSGADATPPSVALQGVATPPVAALSAVLSVSQGYRSHPPPPKGPIPDPPPPCSTHLGSWEGEVDVALPSPRGVAGSLDLRNPVALQGLEQLHLRVSRYTLALTGGFQG